MAKAKETSPVDAYIAKLPAGQQAIVKKCDRIVRKTIPGITRAIKWNVPFYGISGNGWLCAFGSFKAHSTVNFFRGEDLTPIPPDGGVQGNARVAYRVLADIDEAQLVKWLRQAAALPGWLAPPSKGGP